VFHIWNFVAAAEWRRARSVRCWLALWLGTVRFVFEVLDKTRHYSSPGVALAGGHEFSALRVLMFVVCAIVADRVSMYVPAAGAKEELGPALLQRWARQLKTTDVKETPHLRRESAREHRVNLAFTLVLIATVFSLWIYFR